jgi:hypothetical protein
MRRPRCVLPLGRFRLPTPLAEEFVHALPPELVPPRSGRAIPGSTPLKRSLALFAVAVTTSASVAPGAAGSCRLPDGRTIATGRIAKLIALPTPDGSALYACIRRTGRKVPLEIGFTNARLAGRWVAWQRHLGGDWRIVVHDLRSGRERLIVGHAAGSALFLTTTGTAVWAQQLEPDVGVFANDVATGGHLLGRGAIAPASLRLDGRHVSWRAGDGDYSADVR